MASLVFNSLSKSKKKKIEECTFTDIHHRPLIDYMHSLTLKTKMYTTHIIYPFQIQSNLLFFLQVSNIYSKYTFLTLFCFRLKLIFMNERDLYHSSRDTMTCFKFIFFVSFFSSFFFFLIIKTRKSINIFFYIYKTNIL